MPCSSPPCLPPRLLPPWDLCTCCALCPSHLPGRLPEDLTLSTAPSQCCLPSPFPRTLALPVLLPAVWFLGLPQPAVCTPVGFCLAAQEDREFGWFSFRTPASRSAWQTVGTQHRLWRDRVPGLGAAPSWFRSLPWESLTPPQLPGEAGRADEKTETRKAMELPEILQVLSGCARTPLDPCPPIPRDSTAASLPARDGAQGRLL